MNFNSPLTQLSPLSLAATNSSPSADLMQASVSTQIPLEHRQAQLHALAIKVEADINKVLSDVLVKSQVPLDENTRENLKLQIANEFLSKGDAKTLSQLLQQKDLFLLKLLVKDDAQKEKVQWAISQQVLPKDKPLTLASLSNRIWQFSPLQQPTKKLGAIAVLQQAIRETLPKSTDLANTFRQIQKLAQLTPLPDELAQPVKMLQAASPKPWQLSQANSLKRIIQQSGNLWESSLKQTYTINSALNKSQVSFLSANSNFHPNVLPDQKVQTFTSTKNTATTAFDKLIQHLFKPNESSQPSRDLQRPSNIDSKLLPKQTALPSSTEGVNQKQLGVDLKAQLLLIKQLTQLLLKPATQPNDNTPQKPKSIPGESNSSLPKSQHLVKTKTSGDNVKTDNIRAIQQQVIAALAKIQLQQSQVLLQQHQAANDNRSSTTLLQLEIPVFAFDEFHNANIQIDEDWVEKETGDNDSGKTKTRRWKVSLCIELPMAGQFYATLIHSNDQTEVKLWAERADTVGLIREKMQTLEKRLRQQGIQVSSLVCDSSLAVTPIKNRVSCALVDIRT